MTPRVTLAFCSGSRSRMPAGRTHAVTLDSVISPTDQALNQAVSWAESGGVLSP